MAACLRDGSESGDGARMEEREMSAERLALMGVLAGEREGAKEKMLVVFCGRYMSALIMYF